MEGVQIDIVKYRAEYSDLGESSAEVELIALPTNLTVKRSDGQALFSVPWSNFQSAQEGSVWKDGLALTVTAIFQSIPLLNLTKAASRFYDGLNIYFWDENIGRNVKVFFDTGSERTAQRIVRAIYQYRDQYHRQVHDESGPKKRIP